MWLCRLTRLLNLDLAGGNVTMAGVRTRLCMPQLSQLDLTKFQAWKQTPSDSLFVILAACSCHLQALQVAYTAYASLILNVHLTCTCVVCWQMASLAITYQRLVQAARHCCPYTACVHGPGPGLGLALEPDTLNQRMWLHSVRAVFHLCGLAADESAVQGEGEASHWCYSC